MKPRLDSVLASLTEEQRDQLYDWLLSHTYPEVQKLAAKPAEDGGFDLKIHRTTLARFFEAEQSERQARELAELAANAANGDVPDQIDALIQATREKFTRATYELAKAAATDPVSYDRVENALHHMDLIKARRVELEQKKRELDQEDKRMAEQRRQWEFDAAREVMKNFVAYEKIHRRRDINEHSKIWKARDIAFGKAPLPSGSPLPLRDEESEVRGSESAVHPSSVSLPPCVSVPPHSDTLKHDNSVSSSPAASSLSSLPSVERPSPSAKSAPSVVARPNSAPSTQHSAL